MPDYTVVQGDTISSIVDKFGFRKVSTIWDDPHNAALKSKRKDPHILFPGDVIYVPDKEKKKESRGTAQRHRFYLVGEKLTLKLLLKDVNDKPRAKVDCTLVIESDTSSVTTGADGTITKEIPKNAKQGKLVLPDLEVPLMIGHLDPVEEQSGQIARLNNLGYEAGCASNPDDERFESAVEEFQCDQKMDVTGDCDGATQAKLKAVHGC